MADGNVKNGVKWWEPVPGAEPYVLTPEDEAFIEQTRRDLAEAKRNSAGHPPTRADLAFSERMNS